MGSKAGYNERLKTRSPFSNAIKLLCMPQPGQSIFSKYLEGQASICFSNQSIIFIRRIMI